MNLKAKNFQELLTSEEFSKSDIITLQDPANLQKFNLSDFHHLKNNLKLISEGIFLSSSFIFGANILILTAILFFSFLRGPKGHEETNVYNKEN